MKHPKTCRIVCTTTLGALLLCSPAMAQSPTQAPSSTQTPSSTPAPTTTRSDTRERLMVDGEVTKVDAKKGWIDVKTQDGRMKLHFPPSALENVKVGDRVSVEVAAAAK